MTAPICSELAMPGAAMLAFQPTIDSSAPAIWLVTMWLFVLGAVIGSFLNVVIYRLPRGLSLVRPGSQCPSCGHPIRWHDNVPILSWFLLGGRCRDCGARFSSRYAWVEGIVALSFAVLAWLEVFAGGSAVLVAAGEATKTLVYTTGMLWSLYGFHLWLFCSLLCIALIERDGFAAPWPIAAPLLLGGIVLPLLWPFLRPILDLRDPGRAFVDTQLESVSMTGAGLLMAGALGATVAWLVRRRGELTHVRGALLGALCLGLFFGWQAAIVMGLPSIALTAVFARRGARSKTQRRVPATIWYTIGAAAWIATMAWSLRAVNG